MDEVTAAMSSLSLHPDARILNILKEGRWVYTDASFAGYYSGDVHCPIKILEISFMFKKLPMHLPLTFLVHKPSCQVPKDKITELQRRIYNVTGLNERQGNYSFEYVANMFKDLCVATDTQYVFLNEDEMEEAVVTLCQYAKGNFTPVIINLAKERILRDEHSLRIKPDFNACRQHDPMRSDAKWLCVQARVQFIFNCLNSYAWNGQYF